MKASSLSGECASLISVVFGEAAGVDIFGPPGSQETFTYRGRAGKTILLARRARCGEGY
jgi:hypothetical protein